MKHLIAIPSGWNTSYNSSTTITELHYEGKIWSIKNSGKQLCEIKIMKLN